jgi:sec-independent protein translocase protein TatA
LYTIGYMMNLPLFLNDVSGSEIVVIFLFILVFFGSKSIPGIAKTLGKGLYQIRNATSEIQNEIKKSGVDIGKDLNLKNILIEKQEELVGPMDQIYSEIENTIHYDNSTNKKSIENTIPTEDKTVENTTIDNTTSENTIPTENKTVDNTTLEIDSNSSDQKNPVT